MVRKETGEGGVGEPPQLDLDDWRLRAWGQVEQEAEWSWEQFARLPAVEREADLLCGSGRRLEGNLWAGVLTRELLSRIRTRPAATFVMVHDLGGHCTGLSLRAFAASDALFAWSVEGRPLTPERGWPLRLIVPGPGGPKSVKWVSGLEFLNKRWPASLDPASESCGR
jgi:DMSO/TMAO reductase YedYZ molybdopterin-dependent catalytic subunit